MKRKNITCALLLVMWILSLHANATYLVCYYNYTAINREGFAKLTPENIDPNLCTHYVYAYASLDKVTYQMTSSDPLNDVTHNGFYNFTRLKEKNPAAKFMIALGGPIDSKNPPGKYSQLVSNVTNINALVNSAVDFLQRYNFDGLSIDWMRPSSPSDHTGYSNLITALKTAFNSYGFWLSSSITSMSEEMESGYNLTAMNRYLDFVNLLTFNYHVPYFEPSLAQHHAPLYAPIGNFPSNLSVDYSISWWVKNGLSSSLINMGIPFYGYSWKLLSNSTGLPVSKVANGPGPAGNLSYRAGYLAYNEICSYVYNEDWIEVTDSTDPTYAVSVNPPQTWVGYDDPVMVLKKASYILDKRLGGAVVFDISLDDFTSWCDVRVGLKMLKIGANPLTNILKTMLQPNISEPPAINSS